MRAVVQSRPPLWDPMGYSLPGSSVHGIFQARILEWVAIFSSKGSSWPKDPTHVSCVSCIADWFFTTEPPKAGVKWKKVKSLRHVRFFVTPWTVTCQAPLSMGFSKQEYWSGLPFPPPGDLPNPGIEPGSPALQADALPSEPPGKAGVHIL